MDFKPDILKSALLSDLSSLTSDDALAYYRGQILKETLLKKYVTAESDAILHQTAIENFIDRNDSLGIEFVVPDNRRELFVDWKNKIYDLIMTDPWQSSVVTLDACVSYGYSGPGASRGTRHTNFVDKMFNSTLTYTDDFLLLHYRDRLSERWHEAELFRNSAHSVRKVTGNALTTVRKDARKNRCICTEPSLNMFYQLGAKRIFNKILKDSYFLDVSFQADINKKLAQQGSIDGSNATIDLRDASDMIHYDLVRQLFPKEAFKVLDLIRSKTFEVNGSSRALNMISSMGNGFTFSLMTLLLVTLLDVFLRAKGSRYVPIRDGVFGDDIILPSIYANEFIELLSDFGFLVNRDKSFTDGFFRESCGGDYFHGHNVRGVYIKEINNEADIYSAFNRLHQWSVRFGIDLRNCLFYLKGLVEFRPVPYHESDDSGIKIPYERTTNRKRDVTGATRYRPLVVYTRKRYVGDSERNFQGALIGALGGYVRNNRITVRSNNITVYKVAKRSTPNWDYCVSPGFSIRDHQISWDSLYSDPRMSDVRSVT